MALSDLAVFSEYVYSSMTEVLRQNVALFNQASGGTILLQSAAHQGDYSDEAFWKNISGLVRRRNAYGSGTVAEVNMQHLVDTMVKVAAGTPPVRLDPGEMNWIQRSQEERGAALGRQLAVSTLADMVNIAIGCGVTALSNDSEIITDVTGATAPADQPSFINLNTAQSKFGDRSGEILAWVMHSTTLHKLYGNALTNSERLFTYESVNVARDPFGKLLIMTDSAQLVSGITYNTLGLVSGGLRVDQNNDFDDNFDTSNGDENIIRTYQAEWSYNLGVKGYSWDKTNGGKSPTNAALLTSTNWDRYATDKKDLAGVLLKTH